MTGLLLLVVLVAAVRARRLPVGLPGPVLLFCGCVLLALAGCGDRKAFLEVIQLVGITGGAVFAFQSALTIESGRRMMAAMTGGWVASVAIAAAQYLSGKAPADVGGLLGGRALFGVAIAATAPLVFTVLAAVGPRLGRVLPAVAFLAACLVTLYQPAFVLLVVGATAWAALCAGRAVRAGLLGAVILAVLLVATGRTPRPNLLYMAQSVATRDMSGVARRWTLELRAGMAAVRDRPWFGFGPGRYQAVVSSAEYRRFLPPTAENRVEPGTQSGYLVLAVEYGLPAALLLALALLAGASTAGTLSPNPCREGPLALPGPIPSSSCDCAAQSQEERAFADSPGGQLAMSVHGARAAGESANDGMGECDVGVLTSGSHATARRALALTAVLLGLGLLATPLLVQGVGMLVAAVLGACGAVSCGLRTAGGAGREPLWRRAWVQAVVLVGIAIVALSVGGRMRAQVAQVASPAPKLAAGELVVLHARDAAIVPPPFTVIGAPGAVVGFCLAIPGTDKLPPGIAEGPVYEVTLPRAGRYRVWVRAWWQDGCANSCAIAADDGAPAMIGNDATYRVWHWIDGPILDLAAGTHHLRLLPRESGVRVDQLALATDLEYQPVGGLQPSGAAVTSVKAEERQPVSEPGQKSVAKPGATREPRFECPPAWTSEGRLGGPPFCVGVGGAYQVGPEGFMVRLGIPCRRLRENELLDLDTLRQVNLVWISGPQGDTVALGRVLQTLAEEGGTVILEKPEGAGLFGAELLGPLQMAQQPVGHGVEIRAEGSPLLQRLPTSAVLPRDIWCTRLSGPVSGEGYATHGQLRGWGRAVGPALVKKQIGKGTLYFLCAPLGFVSMWRGTWFDPVADDILRDALGDRCERLFESLAWSPAASEANRFDDDFMRVAGELGAWHVEDGSVTLTGDRPPAAALAFALRAEGRAVVRCDRPVSNVRVSAAILADASQGGVWLSAAATRRLNLVYDGAAGLLRLYAQDGQSEKILGEATAAPPPNPGWRRVSLMRRGDAWEAWLDGQRLFTAPAAGDTAQASFGLVNRAGTTHFDDVHVRSTQELLPGRDLCIGEEGSSRADLPYAAGVEPRTVYSPVWWLRPDPQQRHAVRLGMPTYAPAVFSLDDARLGVVPPDSEGPLVYLPEHQTPQRQIEVACPLWHDYTFGGRPVEWYATGSAWQQLPRWACDRKWTFLGVNTTTPSVLWHRQPRTAPYAVSVFVAAGAEDTQLPSHEAGRDLNLVLAGNGRDLAEGYTVRVGPAGAQGCELWQGATKLAANSAIGLPSGHALHHRWFWLKAVVEKDRLRFYYEDQFALDVKLTAPPPKGWLGFWTQNNAVCIARATISASE